MNEVKVLSVEEETQVNGGSIDGDMPKPCIHEHQWPLCKGKYNPYDYRF